MPPEMSDETFPPPEAGTEPAPVEPRSVDQPPPTQFTWDTTIAELVNEVFLLSQDLKDNPPLCILLFADRIQVNWSMSGLEGPGADSTIELSFTARPVAPSTITILPRPAY